MRAKLALIPLLASVALSAPAADDPKAFLTQERPVGSFDTVIVNRTVDADVTVGGAPRLTVEGTKDELDRIRTEVRGATLYIENTRHVQLDFCLFGCTRVAAPRVHIVVPSLVEFDNNGAGDATLKGLAGDKLKVRLSGAGNVEADGHGQSLVLAVSSSGDADFSRFSADSMDVDLSGSGDVVLGGARKSLRLRVSSSGDARINDIDVDSMDAVLDGAGEVVAQGKARSLTLSMSSSGDARFDNFSADDMDLRMSGSGDLHTGGTGRTLQLRMSSSGDAHLRHLSTQSSDVVISGSGGVVADGTSQDLHIAVSSSGEANFGRVTADNVEVDDHGSGDVAVIANSSIRAFTGSSGDIDWRGSASQINVQASGVGAIRRR